MFEIPAGGRRYRALELLVKQKRLNRTAPVPCIVRTESLAEEDSLAQNVQRAPLHPLDQFRAFQAMREKGKSEEEIAAAFFVSATLSLQTRNVRIVPDSRASGENAPSHRVYVGRAEIGAAWSKRSNEGRDYLGLKLDDPSFTAPIYANLFDDEDGDGYDRNVSLDCRWIGEPKSIRLCRDGG